MILAARVPLAFLDGVCDAGDLVMGG